MLRYIVYSKGKSFPMMLPFEIIAIYSRFLMTFQCLKRGRFCLSRRLTEVISVRNEFIAEEVINFLFQNKHL